MPLGRQIIYSSQINLFPPADVCDYVLLDLPQNADASYHYGSYEFLRKIDTAGYRFLFTVDMDAANISNRMVAFNSPIFNRSTKSIQTSLYPGRLLGYGTLHGWPIPQTAVELSTAQAVLNVIYERFAQVINSSGIDEKDITNFFAFKPRVEYSAKARLRQLHVDAQWTQQPKLSDHADHIRRRPEGSHALFSLEPYLPTFELRAQNVSLVANITNPRVTFTLTISLRLDIFHGVSLAAMNVLALLTIRSGGHSAVFFSTECEQLLFGRDPTGVSILNVGKGHCAFAWGPSQLNEVITFETPRTVRNKMVATYRHLGYAKTDTHVIGWTVYNVTLGLAPDTCNGYSNRFNQIRKIVDENK
ncbi:hypothetical protein MTO96_025065 [Rhipicephalus appendiculatus]